MKVLGVNVFLKHSVYSLPSYTKHLCEGSFGYILSIVTLCAQLTRNLLAIAKFLVEENLQHWSLTPGIIVLFYCSR